MLKTSQKTKTTIDSFLNFLLIALIIIFYNPQMIHGASQNWIKVSKTSLGLQYLDIDSRKNKDEGIIEIKTKYIKIDDKNLDIIEENIYTMQINCIKRKYKDISVNGKIIPSAKWESANEDKLINDVISTTCKNV